MPTAERLIRDKGDFCACLPPDATVLDAAGLMNEHHIGSVLVVKGETLVGIFTERDVMRRVVVGKLDPAKTTLDQVMTTAVACGTSNTKLDELRMVMREKRIRHVPIVDEGKIKGIISIGDLNEAQIETQIETIHYLEQYMSRM